MLDEALPVELSLALSQSDQPSLMSELSSFEDILLFGDSCGHSCGIIMFPIHFVLQEVTEFELPWLVWNTSTSSKALLFIWLLQAY